MQPQLPLRAASVWGGCGCIGLGAGRVCVGWEGRGVLAEATGFVPLSDWRSSQSRRVTQAHTHTSHQPFTAEQCPVKSPLIFWKQQTGGSDMIAIASLSAICCR